MCPAQGYDTVTPMRLEPASFVCIEEIKFAIISEFLSPVNFGIFILVDFPILYVGGSYKKFHLGLHCFAK